MRMQRWIRDEDTLLNVPSCNSNTLCAFRNGVKGNAFANHCTPVGIASVGQEYPPMMKAGMESNIKTWVAFSELGKIALTNTPKKDVAIINNPVVTTNLPNELGMGA